MEALLADWMAFVDGVFDTETVLVGMTAPTEFLVVGGIEAEAREAFGRTSPNSRTVRVVDGCFVELSATKEERLGAPERRTGPLGMRLWDSATDFGGTVIVKGVSADLLAVGEGEESMTRVMEAEVVRGAAVESMLAGDKFPSISGASPQRKDIVRWPLVTTCVTGVVMGALRGK